MIHKKKDVGAFDLEKQVFQMLLQYDIHQDGRKILPPNQAYKNEDLLPER